MDENEKVKYFNQRFITLLNRIPIKPVEAVQIEYYTSSLAPNIVMFVRNQEKLTPVDNFVEAIEVEKDLEALSSCLGEEEDEVLMGSNLDRVISQLQDEITNLKKDKGEGISLSRRKLLLALPLKFLQLQESIWRTMLWIIFVTLIVHITLRKLVQISLTHSMHYYFHWELLKRKTRMWMRKEKQKS